MANLRVMSWNLRTYGAPDVLPDYQHIIMQSIFEVKADIVCIQEIQIGDHTGTAIGTPISPHIMDQLRFLCHLLQSNDPGGSWDVVCSGRNKGKDVANQKMTDAYAFFVKTKPSESQYSRRNSLRSITANANAPVNPEILRLHNNFPSRRPGMLYVTANSGQRTTNINIASFHAGTSTNVNYNSNNSPAAGRAIMLLNHLQNIGGYNSGPPNNQSVPLPDTDTVVLGDFNFSVNNPKNQHPYPYDVFTNNNRNYSMCIGNTNRPVLTTYSPNYHNPPNKVSSYDNIFVLQNRNLTNPLKTSGSGNTFDYITHYIDPIVNTYHVSYPQAYYYLYKNQYGGTGLSDHLPVYQDFTLN